MITVSKIYLALQKNIINGLFNVVAILRALGYLGQFFSGLYLAGSINFICVLPLAIWADKGQVSYKNSFLKYLSRNALAIHSYAGVVSSIPIIFFGIDSYSKTSDFAYLEISCFGFLLLITFLILKFKGFTVISDSEVQKWILINKHKIGSFLLLLANILQYHAGVQLGRNGLSVASILFLIAMFVLFFVKNHINTNQNKKDIVVV